MNMEIRVKKLRADALLPVYGSPEAAGADLCVPLDESLTVGPGQTVMVPTGLCAEIPAGYAGFVYARSGLASKSGLAPANKVGVIDSDYRGEIKVALFNHSDMTRTVSGGERVAQLVIAPVARAVFAEAADLNETERGEGGFGSTGK